MYFIVIIFIFFILQLFLKANINLSELTDTLISQNYVGSVIKVRYKHIMPCDINNILTYIANFPYSYIREVDKYLEWVINNFQLQV